MAEQYSAVYAHHIFSMSSPSDGDLDGFHISATVESTASNSSEQVSLQHADFISFRYTLRARRLDHTEALVLASEEAQFCFL